MKINRRGFLKLAAISTALVVVPGIAVSQSQIVDLHSEGKIYIGDLVLEKIEILPNIFFMSHDYRGIVYCRNKPNDKKYFQFLINDLDYLKKKSFQNDLYKNLSIAFRATI